jgi:CHAD domain-containing protein
MAPRKARPIALSPATSVAAARRTALREAFNQIFANAPGAAAGKDPEYLHQLRVGMRRLRAALRAFRGTLHDADMRALRRLLRMVAAATGPARDWDVYSRRLPAALRAAAQRRRSAAHAALRRVLGGMQLWLLPRSKPRAKQPLPDFARGALEELERKALRGGSDIDWTRAGKRHALRIRLRRLRYASEFLAGAFPGRDSEPLTRNLKQLQDLLGELNDLEVARRLTRELTGKRRTRLTSMRERRLLRRLPAAWKRYTAAPRFWR